MLFLHRWKFFSNKGNDLNLTKVQKIDVSITDTTGQNAKLQPITDPDGNLVYLEIINPGLGYTAPEIEITDENGTVHTIPTVDITLDVDNGIDTINLGAPTANAWSYPSFTWEGKMYFQDTISTDLIENEHIFIVEEVRDPAPPNEVGYVYPRYNDPNGKIRWKWTDEYTEESDQEALFIFDVDTESSLTPFIEKVENYDLDLEDGSADPTTSGDFYTRSIVDDNDSSIQLNIGLSYPSEGVFERKLELYDFTDEDNPYLLASIDVTGEVVPEDERFATILDNLGQKISAEEEFIFRDSDINEDLPNYKLLNEKRKEFILEHSNITPFIGSYKALFNVINWLGYNDLTIKEYWLNVAEGTLNYNKYKPIEVPFDLAQKGGDYKSAALLPSSKYKKTNLFGLYYDINRRSGEFDEFGIPETEDAFMFTIEEVLIKLFALKRYLKAKFLPLNARIIDIVGEGIYFERYRVNSWTDGTRIIDVDLTREAQFTCEPHEPNVIDLRLLDNYEFFQPATLKAIVSSATKEVVGISVIDPGFGYAGSVDVEIVGGAPTVPAEATVTINAQGSVTSVVMTNNGSGYATAPVVTVTPEPTLPKSTTQISAIQNRLTGFFDGINTLDIFPDEPNISVGAPVTLKTSTFDITWDDIQFPWDSFYYDFRPAVAEAIIDGTGALVGFNIIDPGQGYLSTPTVVLEGGSPTTPAVVTATILGGRLDSLNIVSPGVGYITPPTINLIGGAPVSVLNTWDTIGIGDFYEMEWIVKGQLPVVFEYRIRGRVDELREHLVILPFIGKYDVELILYDTDNNWTNEIKKGCVDVKMPKIEFTTFGRFGQCYQTWDDLDMTWDEANYMWIHPIKHEVTWDDLDLTWDDLDLKTYTDQYNNVFPAILEKEVLRLTETDRFLGNLTGVDYNTNTINVQDPVIQPRVETGDFLYFRQGDTTFRSQIVTADYDYSVESVDITSTIGPFVIERDFTPPTPPPVLPADPAVIISPTDWDIYTPESAPIVVISPPPTGVTATAIPILDCSVVYAEPTSLGSGYTSANPFGGVGAGPSGGNILRVDFQAPLDPLGTFASCLAEFNTSGQFLQWVDASYVALGTYIPTTPGSGYNTIPNSFQVFDGLGAEVINGPTDNDLFFKIRISGNLSEIVVTNEGSGYLTPPTATIYPATTAAGFTTTSVNLNSVADTGTFTMSVLPRSVNPTWNVLREIGRTILTQGNAIYNADTNPVGIKIGDWLKLRGSDAIPKIPRIPIATEIFDGIGILSGINLTGDRTDFRVGEKCSIYRVRNLTYGTGSAADEFSVDVANNEIRLYAPTYDPLVEITPGFHEIILSNWNTTTSTFDYNQRVLVVHIREDLGDYVLTVEAIDGDLSLFNNDSSSTLEYQFFDFPAVIDETILVGSDTDIILNINDWPVHDTFSPSTETWYIDYGAVSGDWALLVNDIGIEGNNTLITVDDPNSELWRSSTSFMLGWRNFDEDYAERRIGTEIHTWENHDEVTWDDMCHLTWDMLEYKNYNYCGFRINQVATSGRIQWNEDPVFEFTTVVGTDPLADQINNAVAELNATDNSGLSRFSYTAMPDSTSPTYIMATSKSPGGDSLGYIRFTNGVEGEYTADPTLSHTFPLNNTDNPLWTSGYYGPNNKPADWDPTIRAYNEWGVDPAGDIGWYPAEKLPKVYQSTQETWKSERIPYLHALGGPLTWSETYVSPRNSEIPIYTTMFFTASGCSIAGKTQYLWRIYDVATGNVIMESIKPYLIWTFTNVGEFSVELEIKDSNGNTTSSLRKGFIKTYKPSKV